MNKCHFSKVVVKRGKVSGSAGAVQAGKLGVLRLRSPSWRKGGRWGWWYVWRDSMQKWESPDGKENSGKLGNLESTETASKP